MTDAIGIHDHPTKKLGRRPADPNKRRLQLSSFLVDNAIDKAAALNYPTVDTAPNLKYPMDRNDQAGDCVVAGSDHGLQVIYTLLTGRYTNWSDNQLLFYYQTQNPNFTKWTDGGGPNDGGMLVQDFLSYLVKNNVILGFAAIDPTNEAEMKAATYLGLAIITGEDLKVAQQNQTVWDYDPNSPDWGGHCTVTVGYKGNPDNQTVVTWGQLQDVTNNFVKNQISEAWFIVTQAHVDHPGFRAGFDLAKFSTEYTALTGRPFPVNIAPTPVPPAPVPSPTPTPNPVPVPPAPGGDNPFRQALAKYPTLLELLDANAKKHNMTFDDYCAWRFAVGAHLA